MLTSAFLTGGAGRDRTDDALLAFQKSEDRSQANPTCATGGADRDRTDDPLLAKQVLSQLSYSPAFELAVF